MKRFFHVDRILNLQEGQEINLVKYNDIKPDELQTHVNFLFPDGISYQGKNYIWREIKNLNKLYNGELQRAH